MKGTCMKLIKTIVMFFGWVFIFAVWPLIGLALLLYFIYCAIDDDKN
jgi:hypothetical protein